MRPKLSIALLILAALLAGALVLLGISSAHPHNSHLTLTIKDTTFQFRLVEITRGTNHVMYTGNPATATLKRILCESGVGPVMKLAHRIHAQSYQRATPRIPPSSGSDGSAPTTSQPLDHRLRIRPALFPSRTVAPPNCVLSEVRIRPSSTRRYGLGNCPPLWLPFPVAWSTSKPTKNNPIYSKMSPPFAYRENYPERLSDS